MLIEGYSGNEIIFLLFNGLKEKDKCVEGLWVLISMGFEDNIGIGFFV